MPLKKSFLDVYLNTFIPGKIILIGASTGGPGQIEKIIRSLEVLHDTTIIIAQHMSLEFIPSLQKDCKTPVLTLFAWQKMTCL